jgi:hypothetical protein
MTGIDSLEYRLEKFLELAIARQVEDEELLQLIDCEVLARDIAFEFGKELRQEARA